MEGFLYTPHPHTRVSGPGNSAYLQQAVCGIAPQSSDIAFTLASFRQIPAFGETTIRRFEGDVSEMKKLAGHDFEDLLQVSVLPEPSLHNHQFESR